MEHFNEMNDDITKYIYLNSLAVWNEKLFYNILRTYLKECLPYIYTPVVGLVCLKYSFLYLKPRGMYITILDKGHVADILRNWPESDVRVVCVTDGGRILGLGDLGANGMGIVIGKLTLYTALAGVKPHRCLPITLDMGCNTDSIREDPMYIGLRRTRPQLKECDEFIDEFMDAVVNRWGSSCLIHFEDFANLHAFRYLERYGDTFSMFNDDVQGTSAVCVGGILSALRAINGNLTKQRFLFMGAGEAAMGIADLVLVAFESQGVSRKAARKRIWMFDSNGLIVHNRPKGPPLDERKRRYCHKHAPVDTLEEAVRIIQPTILIGACTVKGAFNKNILQMMAEFNSRPIILALSNPTSKSECTAAEAYEYTNGTCMFASGSPFPPVTYNGHTYITGLANNAFVFPGIGLAATSLGIKTFPEKIFLWMAKVLCDICTPADYKIGRIYPPVSAMPCTCFEIAVCVANYAYANDLAYLKPAPPNLRNFLKSQMYNLNYKSSLPRMY